MKKVILAKDINKNTLRMIRGYMLIGNTENIYMVFGNPGAKDRHYLDSLGFKEQGSADNNEQYRDDFLRGYIDLIGGIGKENNFLEWWATDIASKNRFTSRITELLSNFFDIVRTARNKQFGIMVVVNPDWTIVSSLKKAFLKDRVDFIIAYGFLREKFFSLVASRSKSLILAVCNFWKMGARSAYCRFLLGKTRTFMNDSGPYYAVKTFIYNRSFSEGHDYKDDFFGKLPHILSKDRKVLIFAYILGNYRYCLRKIEKCDSAMIIPLEYFIAFRDLISAFKRFIFFRVAISGKNMLGYEVGGIVRNELDRTWNGIQYYQLIHYWALKRMLSRVKVDTFLLTYENNPWEKMCISALRQVSPNTFIIGYQHTIVCQASANMFPSRYENGIMPLPDRIVTVGSATKKIIERYGNFGNIPIQSSCALRFEYLFNTEPAARRNNGNILLALDGVKAASKLVAYALRELGGNNEYKVRIRTHPLVSWQYLQRKNCFKLSKYPNFHLSPNQPVRSDLEWASVVIYWGSTISLEALNIGRPVVHYRTGSILDYDPLFESPVFKWVISESISLPVVLGEISSLSDEEFIYGWEKARTYLNSYFFPITEENLAGFIHLR